MTMDRNLDDHVSMASYRHLARHEGLPDNLSRQEQDEERVINSEKGIVQSRSSFGPATVARRTPAQVADRPSQARPTLPAPVP